MGGFEEYLEKANRAKTPNELFDVFRGTVQQHGFDKVLFALITDHKDIGLNAGIGVMENYPEDWIQYYFEQGLDQIDPIVTYGVHQMGSFAWEDIPKRTRLLPKQMECLNLGSEAGLNNGISIPLRGINNQMAGFSLASSEKVDACHLAPDLMTAYCNHFYIAFKRLHEKKPLNSENIVLTPREKEVLKWAAVGKADEDIATILNMSKHTVNMHFRNIYKKLDVNNRVLAVVKSLSIGLIHV